MDSSDYIVMFKLILLVLGIVIFTCGFAVFLGKLIGLKDRNHYGDY